MSSNFIYFWTHCITVLVKYHSKNDLLAFLGKDWLFSIWIKLRVENSKQSSTTISNFDTCRICDEPGINVHNIVVWHTTLSCGKQHNNIANKNFFYTNPHYMPHDILYKSINFEKLFSNKVFYILKLVTKFKFHIWMNISGSKSVKKSQKMLKKSHNLDLHLVFWKKNCLG